MGDVLATGFWAARISEITPEDTVLILGAGPTGICTLLCVMLHSPKRIIVCEKDESRLQFIRQHYPQVLTVQPEDCAAFVRAHSDHGGADVVLEVAGADSTFRLAWECARPNAVVTVVALYDKAQTLPLPEMYGKNLTFKTGGVDGCDCEETLRLIAEGKIDTVCAGGGCFSFGAGRRTRTPDLLITNQLPDYQLFMPGGGGFFCRLSAKLFSHGQGAFSATN